MSLASFLAVARAHSEFIQLESGGTLNPIAYAIRDPSYDGPINDVTTNPMACNGGPNPTTPSSNIINVAAGSTVQATWRHTLTSTAANDAVYVIDPSHKGPITAYLKKVDNALTDVGYGSGWFKVSEAGYNPTTKTWAVDDLIANKGVQNIPIPSCIANGQYLLRAELIALHAAGSSLGAQIYMECAQINITGGTGATSPATVSIPGAYAQNDPGILINIYQTITSYPIPGPRPLTCGAGSAPPATTLVTSVAKPTSTTTSTVIKPTSSTTVVVAKPSTTSSAAPVSTAGGSSPLYGQCGGIGWTGPTTCSSGTCKSSGAYYSQCTP